MNALARIGLALALIIAAGVARAEDRKETHKNEQFSWSAKLVGSWKVVKAAEGVPEDTLVIFTKDGKLMVVFTLGGEKKSFEGNYKVRGNKLHTTVKIDDTEMTDTDTIKTLTDDKVSLVDKDGKATELEKFRKR